MGKLMEIYDADIKSIAGADHRLVEFVIGLPSSFKINKGYTKFILRTALTELPEASELEKKLQEP